MRRVPRLPIDPPVLVESGRSASKVSKHQREPQRPPQLTGSPRRWARWSFNLHLKIDPWKSRLV